MKKILHTIRAYGRLIYQLAKLFGQLLHGIWRISKLHQAPVTIFGGTYLDKHSVYMHQAQELARILSYAHIPVLTGGGPGIMQAANCGAAEEEHGDIISTMGITVKGLEEINICAKNNLVMSNFASRKWLLINYSAGFAVFPGGIGTLNELTELLTLIQANKHERTPIVLIGKNYWKSFMVWLEMALKHGLIKQDVIELFTITDDITHASKLLKEHCMKTQFSVFDVQY